MHVISKPLLSLALIASLSGCQLVAPKPQVPEVTTPVVEVAPPTPSCPEPEIKEVIKWREKTCPKMPPAVIIKEVSTENKTIAADKIIVGRVEYVRLGPEAVVLKSRVDTGAKTTSMHAEGLQIFERDGKRWAKFLIKNRATQEDVFYERPIIKFVRIKQMVTENQRRPVVLMTLALGPIKETLEVTLTDRGHYNYPVLIGRNFLLDRYIVDVSEKFIHKIE